MANYQRTADPYQKININEFSKAANRDPMFALGYLLAQGWSNNYNQRGIDKGVAAGQEIINEATGSLNTPPQSAQPASDELYNSAISAGALAERNNPYGNQSVQERAASAVMSDQPKLSDGSSQQEPQQLGPTREQITQNKLDYFANKYSNSANPDGDAMAAQSIATAAEQNLNRINALQGFNKTDVRKQIVNQLIADGRPAAQRDAIMEHLDPILDAKEKSVNDELFNLHNQAYQASIAAGDYDSAQGLLTQMARYNPELASVAAAGNPTRRDLWNLEQQEKKEQRSLARQKELIDYQAARSASRSGGGRASSGGSSGSAGGSRSGSGLTTAALNAIKERIDDRQNFFSDPENAGKEYPYEREYRQAQEALSRAHGYVPQDPETSAQTQYTPLDIDDYNQMDEWVTGAFTAGRNAGLSNDEIISRVRQQFGGNSGYLEQVLIDKGYLDAPKTSSAEPAQESGGSFFDFDPIFAANPETGMPYFMTGGGKYVVDQIAQKNKQSLYKTT